MVDDSRTTEAMVDDRLCDDDSTRTINSTSTISDRVLDGDKCSSSGVHEDFSGVDGKRTVQATIVADCHRGNCTRMIVVAVKPPSPPPLTIITVRVRVGGVLVLPDSSTVHSRKMLPLQQSSYLIPSRSPTMVVGLERCSAPPIECDLYHQRTHLCVSSGASCRTCVEQNISHHPPSIFISPGVPPWVKPYKSKASSSVCTQCASIAHTAPVSYKALHRHFQRAKNKMAKQQRLLREVNEKLLSHLANST
jgi:hypothetical protein